MASNDLETVSSDFDLRFKKTVVYKTEFNDLNKFISKKYDIPLYECHLDSPNDVCHTFLIREVMNSEYDKKRADALIARGNCEYWNISYILTDMWERGWIPPGEYLVNVSW